MTQTGNQRNVMKRGIKMRSFFIAAMAAFILAVAAPVVLANDESEIPYDLANLFFELNDTDRDLGIHALIDGEAWGELEIEDPSGREMLDIRVKGRLRKQGLAEIFFESAEPTFDELPPSEFFRRFPQGIYEIGGVTPEGDALESKTGLTHVMPAPPAPTVNGKPMATQCDPDEAGYDAPEVTSPVTIAWPKITMSHPDPLGGGAGVQPQIPVIIRNYEVVLEVLLEVNGEEFASVLSVILPPGKREFTMPAEFIALGDEFKYEVLAREESFNQTAVESCFVLK